MKIMAVLGPYFQIGLFVLMIITGVIWALDRYVLSKKRRLAADAALAEFDARQAHLVKEGIKVDGDQSEKRMEIEKSIMRTPTWVEYTGAFFPVIVLVFFVRSFLFEPFKIPSSSMVPTLQVGDLILVNKYTYGIRLPIINKKIISINEPKRGDVMVFKYPPDTSLDYIKRIVGVPGDKVEYKNKRLSINGQPVEYKELPDYLSNESLRYMRQLNENLNGVSHNILTDDARPPYLVPAPDNFPQHERCTYNTEGFVCTVPPGHYFMMGDNRDNSLDSRWWGFVPDENIVGRAFFVWMNLGDLKRIGSFQ
ncbi:signal peptidase I [Massilia sp. W12]|uniref:signal peptidase I n=1 Tax=Massilia sp. W12 TaxID=3126507 RepID=UPI0030CDBB89